MAWYQAAGMHIPQQLSTGLPASGYWIKFWAAGGTSTALSFATDSTGGTTVTKAELDTLGQIQTTGGSVFVPHVEEAYSPQLYPTEADADANTNGIWPTQNLIPRGLTDATSTTNLASQTTPGTSLVGHHDVTLQAHLEAAPTNVDSIAAAQLRDFTEVDRVQTASYAGSWSGGTSGPIGGGVYHSDGTTGTASTLYTNRNGFFDSQGKGFKLVIRGLHVDATQFGVTADGTTDDTAAAKAAIAYAAVLQDASGGNSITIQWPRGIIVLTSELYISSFLRFRGAGWRETVFRCNHTGIFLYTAVHSSGTFTDNLDENVNGAFDVTNAALEDFAVDHNGTITGNSPDTGIAYRAVIQLQAFVLFNIQNIRIDTITDDISGLDMRHSFIGGLERVVATQSSGGRGGAGIVLRNVCNNILLTKCQAFGGWEWGYKVDATTVNSVTGGIDSVTFLECDVEQIDYEDSGGDAGTGYGYWIGGDTEGVRVAQIKCIGGYTENCDIDVKVGSSVTGAVVWNFRSESMYHGQWSKSIHAYEFVNSRGHQIIKPRMSKWDFKTLVLTGVTGTADEGETIAGVDRFGNAVQMIVDSWTSGSSTLIVKHLSGPLDPASALTGDTLSATLSTFSNAITYGESAGQTHFKVDNNTTVFGGYYHLDWYDAQDFEPINVGLQDGSGRVELDGLNGTFAEVNCGRLFPELSSARAIQYNKEDLSQATIDAGVIFFRVVIPNESFGQFIKLDMTISHQCELTASPTANNSQSVAHMTLVIQRPQTGEDADAEVTLVSELFSNNGSGGNCQNISAGSVTTSGTGGAAELEVTVKYLPLVATDPSTTNRLTVYANRTRHGGIKVYSANPNL